MTAQIIDLNPMLETRREAESILREAKEICARAYAAFLIAERLHKEAQERDDISWRLPCDSEVPFGEGA